MADHPYDPAVAAAGAIVRIDDTGIARLDRSGSSGPRIGFDEIERVRWHQTYTGKFVTRSLDLHGSRRAVKISQAMPARGGAGDPRVAAYLGAVSSVLSSLGRARPELRVDLSQPPFLRWFLFGCYLAVVPMLGFLISAVLDSRHADDLWWVTVILALCVAASLFLAWRGRPWNEGERMEPAQLAAELGHEDPPR